MWLRVIFVVFTVLKIFGAQNVTKECDKETGNQTDGFRGTSQSVNTRRLYDPDTSEMMDDMIMTKEVKEQLLNPNTDNRRNAPTNEEILWPDKTVRFFIDREFDKTHRLEIMKGIDMIQSTSCVKFEELKEPPANPSREQPYLHINSISGCYATIGSACEKCEMSLDIKYGCVYPGKVAHEFLHVLGFYHMHSTAGRGDYIEIVRENIKDGFEGKFEEYADTTTLLGTEYDYESILHYGNSFYTKNGGYTIKTKDPKYQLAIGQQINLSLGDIERVNKLYKC